MTTTSQGRSTHRPYTNNAQRGAALEELLNWRHSIYEANQQALIYHNGTAGKMVKGKAILIKSMPDYSGLITSMGGKYVCFDAKLTSTPRYHHPKDRLHQLSMLWRVQEAGGVAFLLVSVNLEKFYLLWPQVSWRDMRPFNLNLDVLERHHGVQIGRTDFSNLPCWLSTIRALYGAEEK